MWLHPQVPQWCSWLQFFCHLLYWPLYFRRHILHFSCWIISVRGIDSWSLFMIWVVACSNAQCVIFMILLYPVHANVHWIIVRIVPRYIAEIVTKRPGYINNNINILFLIHDFLDLHLFHSWSSASPAMMLNISLKILVLIALENHSLFSFMPLSLSHVIVCSLFASFVLLNPLDSGRPLGYPWVVAVPTDFFYALQSFGWCCCQRPHPLFNSHTIKIIIIAMNAHQLCILGGLCLTTRTDGIRFYLSWCRLMFLCRLGQYLIRPFVYCRRGPLL